MRVNYLNELERYYNQLFWLIIRKKEYRKESFSSLKSFYRYKIKSIRIYLKNNSIEDFKEYELKKTSVYHRMNKLKSNE